jgi:lysophospholipase L1-like esterase
VQYKSSIKQKFLLILFGVLIAAILAEGFFRVGGIIINKTMMQKDKVINDASNIILCLGDSSTYGIGASNFKEYSYPAQLQKIFNEKNTDMNFQVINGGIP